MKKSTIIVLVILAVLAIGALSIFGMISGTYNSLVKMDEGVKASWAQVENVYQRRADLIPNLVEVVKGYAKHEKDTLQGVVDARSKVGSVTLSKDILNDPKAFKQYQARQGELSSALSRLLMVTENYPQLKANENFLSLQAQLEGTENRIAVERKRFNEASQAYNTKRRMFPGIFIANMYGFAEKPYFEAEKGAKEAPKVQF